MLLLPDIYHISLIRQAPTLQQNLRYFHPNKHELYNQLNISPCLLSVTQEQQKSATRFNSIVSSSLCLAVYWEFYLNLVLWESKLFLSTSQIQSIWSVFVLDLAPFQLPSNGTLHNQFTGINFWHLSLIQPYGKLTPRKTKTTTCS